MSLGTDYFSSYASGAALKEKNTVSRFSSQDDFLSGEFSSCRNEDSQDSCCETPFSPRQNAQPQKTSILSQSFTIPRPPVCSLTLLIRSFVLAAAFVSITLIAVYWEDIPEIRQYVQSLLRGDGNELGGMVFAHQSAEDSKDLSQEGNLSAEEGSESKVSEKESEEIAQIRQLMQQNESGTLLPSEGSLLPEMTSSANLLPQNAFSSSPADLASKRQDDSLSDEMSQTLQLLGAQKIKLKRWGNNGEYWRYSCEARPEGDCGFSKYFEAVGRSPEEAAQAVAAKISGWQRGQNKAFAMGRAE